MDIEVRGKSFKIEFFCNEATDLFNKLMDLDAGTAVTIEDVFKKRANATTKALDIVEVILDSQGLEYDKKWWFRKTNTADILAFIVECYQMELVGVKKNTAKKES